MKNSLPSLRLTKSFIFTSGLLCSLFYSICGAADIETKESDVITGAGAHFAWVIFHDLKEELEGVTGKQFQLFGENSNLGMGCNAGIKLAQQSTHNHQTFGFVCCPLSQKELDDKQLKIYTLAEEAIIILVNKDNPIENLSSKQVGDIFSGEIVNWKDVGGWDKPIVVVTRLHCKKRPGHWKTILPSAESFVEKRLNVSSAKEMVKLVTSFDTSIGHIGATWKFGNDSNVKAIKVDNVEATAANLKNKSYPYHRMLSAITNMDPTKDVLTAIEQVQRGKSFESVAKKFNLLPLNTSSSN